MRASSTFPNSCAVPLNLSVRTAAHVCSRARSNPRICVGCACGQSEAVESAPAYATRFMSGAAARTLLLACACPSRDDPAPVAVRLSDAADVFGHRRRTAAVRSNDHRGGVGRTRGRTAGGPSVVHATGRATGLPAPDPSEPVLRDLPQPESAGGGRDARYAGRCAGRSQRAGMGGRAAKGADRHDAACRSTPTAVRRPGGVRGMA